MRIRIKRVLVLVTLTPLLSAGMIWAQATTSLRGTVKDQSGAVVPNANVKLTNTLTGAERTTTTSGSGDYHFLEVVPGSYTLELLADGFRRFELKNVQLLVNTPATINVDLEIGERTETVEITSEGQVLNTTDASLGIAFSENQVKQLPMEARNVPDLLSLQAGVVYTGNRQDVDRNYDTRSGAVNGARSDQSNITLDGVDVNDQANGYAFTSVLPVTLDSVQEFRVTTSNYNANEGRSSGAQVSLVTKGGTNEFHGSLYEYHRNTVTSANDYFIKRAQLGSGDPNEAPKLIRNIFGGSLGGPIKKDRLFFFLNYEGRRDREEQSVLRYVPTATMRQGIIQYQNVDGGVTTLTPQNLTAMDPLHLGPNPVVMAFLQSYPLPNDNSVGDGINTSGYRFKGRVARSFDYYVGRLDYKLTENGNHSVFWRGSLQNVSNPGPPFLPGTTSLHTLVDYSKGFVAGYTAVLRPTLVNNFRWGFTRQSSGNVGRSNEPWIVFRSLNDDEEQQGISRTSAFQMPVHNFVEDLSWVKSRHSLQFGTNLSFVRNPRYSTLASFSSGSTNASYLPPAGIAGTGIELDPGVNGFPDVDSAFANSYDYPVMDLMGIVAQVSARYNYDKSGNLLAQGAPVTRHFAANGYEFYIQDAFRWKPNFTVTYGLRYQLFSPFWETNGLQTAPSFSLGQFFDQRGRNMFQGIPSNQDPLITFDLAGPGNGKSGGFYDWDKKNFAPRLSIAYSPRASSGWLKRLLGDGDKTVIRAGGGIVYDRIGQGLLSTFDRRGSFGLSTLLTNPAGVEDLTSSPRVTSMNVIPTTDKNGHPILIPAPPGTFPQTPPSTLDAGGFNIGWGLDNSIKTPYSYALDASIGRELPRGFSIEVSYVGRLSHRLLTVEDLAMPLNLVDKKSGIDYFSAASTLSKLAAAGTPTDSINASVVGPTAVYWANMLQPLKPGGAYACASCSSGSTTNPLVAAYDLFSSQLYNETTALFYLDYPSTQTGSNGINDVDGTTQYFPIGGPNSFWNRQYSSLYAWRSIGNANYHAMQLSLRKRMSQGIQFDFNYTLSKSIDLSSDATRSDFMSPSSSLGGEVINSWSHKQLRGVSDFDVRHQLNANWVAELPFGSGRLLGRDAHGFLEAMIGGWQLSGLYRWTSGFPVNVFNGATWPTNWELGGSAFRVGQVVTGTTKSADGVNMFPDPTAAFNAFRFDYPGESGVRNVVRGDGFFNIDMGLSKRWKMPWAEKQILQFRWEVFNITNSVRFDVQSNTPALDNVTEFGKYTGLLTNPRIMQFALRYEF
jgi:hypothetical protein